MQIQLLQGEFSASDSLNILAQMIQVKIRHHENAIAQNSSEEDIEYRESRIRSLQGEWHELKKQLAGSGNKVSLQGSISIN